MLLYGGVGRVVTEETLESISSAIGRPIAATMLLAGRGLGELAIAVLCCLDWLIRWMRRGRDRITFSGKRGIEGMKQHLSPSPTSSSPPFHCSLGGLEVDLP